MSATLAAVALLGVITNQFAKGKVKPSKIPIGHPVIKSSQLRLGCRSVARHLARNDPKHLHWRCSKLHAQVSTGARAVFTAEGNYGTEGHPTPVFSQNSL